MPPPPDQKPAVALPFSDSMLLGIAQILIWGGSFFLLTVLAEPIHRDTGWSMTWIYGALTAGVLISALLSPRANIYIARGLGRKVLIGSSGIVALGLCVIGIAPNIPVFVAGWCVIGVGMAGGLYDPLFTTLGIRYGQQARPAINAITLIAGFTTTIIWPALAWIVEPLGWRTTCGIYAGVLAITMAPLYLKALPKDIALAPQAAPATAAPSTAIPSAQIARSTYWLLSCVFSIAAVIMTGISVQIIVLLQGIGHSAASAIALSALIGPAMVAMRVVTFSIKRLHPIWMGLISAGFVAIGLVLILISPTLAAIGMVCYGIGNGLRALVRGTLPIALLPPHLLAPVMGKLTRSSWICQAFTPLICGTLITHIGALGTLLALTALAVINLGLTLWLKRSVMTASQHITTR